MPRPPRCRRICGVPQVDTFYPNECENTEPILLTLDEYEVIRLVDLEQRTHEQCATQMDISHSTVQEIYENYGIKTYPIVTVREIIETLYNTPVDGKVYINDAIKAKMEDYLAQYGI